MSGFDAAMDVNRQGQTAIWKLIYNWDFIDEWSKNENFLSYKIISFENNKWEQISGFIYAAASCGSADGLIKYRHNQLFCCIVERKI